MVRQVLYVSVLPVAYATLRMMSRHTTFKFCLDPTVEQKEVLARHARAARLVSTSAYGSSKPH